MSSDVGHNVLAFHCLHARSGQSFPACGLHVLWRSLSFFSPTRTRNYRMVLLCQPCQYIERGFGGSFGSRFFVMIMAKEKNISHACSSHVQRKTRPERQKSKVGRQTSQLRWFCTLRLMEGLELSLPNNFLSAMSLKHATNNG